MEFAKVEILAVRDAASKAEEVVCELTELDLALVGGGTGDIHFG